MRTTLRRILVLPLILTLLCGGWVRAAEAAPAVRVYGDYIPALVTFGVSGQTAADSYDHLTARFSALAETYGCDVHVWAWQGLDSSSCGYASYEEARAATVGQYGTENAVCLLYIAGLGRAEVHVGGDIAPDFDAAALGSLLPEAGEDAFSHMARVFDDLCWQLGQATGTYVTSMHCSDSSREALRQAAQPLSQVFSGYLRIEILNQTPEDRSSVLRRDRLRDYDAEYAQWEQTLDYYFRDAIYLTYYTDTGLARIDIGENAGVTLTQAEVERLEAAFQPPAADGDLSGFAAGIAALAEAVESAESGVSAAGILGICITVAAVLAAAAAAVLIVRKRRRSR